MTYEEFLNFVPSKCVYETIYDDSDGRTILVIRLLDAFSMANKAQRTWVELTDEEIDAIYLQHHNQYNECESPGWGYERALEARLKEKNYDN